MKCVICGIEVYSMEESINEGWILYFYEGEIECGPACAECSGTLMQAGKDGEMRIKEQYRGKLTYKGNFLEEDSEENILIGIAIENSMQSILN